MIDPIPEPKPGEPISAEWGAKVARRCNREITGQDFFEDEFGTNLNFTGNEGGRLQRHFELKETLNADSSTGATAHPRDYDASANGGEGGYTTDTTASREFTVKDTREVGYNGSAGAKGACIMKTADNGSFGEIIDMECP
ncbi:MAG: hypothetical protein U9Q82_11240 [Chloroflexota bacterium]|nr:hypothetical protein [Chloroflexota bacterium]